MNKMEFKEIITIDCGVSNGGIVLFNGEVKAIPMPVTTELTKKKTKNGNFKKKNSTDIARISQLFSEHREALVMIEKLSIFPRDSDTLGKKFMIQRMMANYEAILTVMKIFIQNYIEVSPRTWQSYLNLVVKGESKEERKKRYKRSASLWHPDIKVTEWNADALCLLQFARRKGEYEPEWIKEKLPERWDRVDF